MAGLTVREDIVRRAANVSIVMRAPDSVCTDNLGHRWGMYDELSERELRNILRKISPHIDDRESARRDSLPASLGGFLCG